MQHPALSCRRLLFLANRGWSLVGIENECVPIDRLVSFRVMFTVGFDPIGHVIVPPKSYGHLVKPCGLRVDLFSQADQKLGPGCAEFG